VGDHLYTGTATTETVIGVWSFTGGHDMYNLTVEDLHTYYVIAGSVPVLVHNCPPVPPGVANSWSGYTSAEDSFSYHYNKHGAPHGVTPEQYAEDAANWAASNPARGANSSRWDMGDGTFGVKYTTPGGGKGGIIGPDGKIVSFWYN
jgi:hypothetical protein